MRMLFERLQALPGLLRRHSYFELPPDDQDLVNAISESSPGRGFPAGLRWRGITGWSFVAHPLALESAIGKSQSHRWIATVDSRRQETYEAVLKLCGNAKEVGSVLYSGGEIDFVLDLEASDAACKAFLVRLLRALRSAVDGRDCRGPKELVRVFRVLEPTLIAGGKLLSDTTPPTAETLGAIASDPTRFTAVLSNYRSAQARRLFDDDDSQLSRYLQGLARAHAILSYRVRSDVSCFPMLEYVAAALPHLLDPTELTARLAGRRDARFWDPIRELFRVEPSGEMSEVDDAGRITHVFVNEYDGPGQRQIWRRMALATLGAPEATFCVWPIEGLHSQRSRSHLGSSGFARRRSTEKRFLVGLSFAGEHRRFFHKLARAVARRIGKDRVLYDGFHKEEFAILGLATHLPPLYRKCTLVIVGFCKEYRRKRWCGLEWRHIHDLVVTQDTDRILPLKMDAVRVDRIPGLTKGDWCTDVRTMSFTTLGQMVFERLARLQGVPVDEL